MYGIYSHFYSLDLDPPGIRCLVQGDLHVTGNALPLGEDVTEALCAQNISLKKGM